MQNTDHIVIRGARQNNLKGFDLELPLNQLIVVTGLSGSGKSSLAFDTVYAEGQRRYIETFSPYARQFLERMDKPQVDSIEGIPPAIAIQATNLVKTSRSTVGTMTEICDYMKLLWPRIAQLYCSKCGKEVRKDTPATVWNSLQNSELRTLNPELLICFPLPLPKKTSTPEAVAMLKQQGFLRVWQDGQAIHLEETAGKLKRADTITVIQDRIALTDSSRKRFLESCESAFHFGKGKLSIIPIPTSSFIPHPSSFSSHLHCAACDIAYREPTSSLFSFNNPLGACPTCRGFGRTIEIDYGLCLPNKTLSIAQGVVRPWQTGMSKECQDDLLKFCRKRNVPTDVPFKKLSRVHQDWLIYGDTGYGKDDAHRWPHAWYGIKGFFTWLEGRSYKMHVRVFLARYRAYRRCTACGGGRLMPEAMNWKVNGNSLSDFYALPVSQASAFCETHIASKLPEPETLLAREVQARLRYLLDVGLGYLTLDRQSRTLSGGEVQRVNLTTCLGTSLVNTLFVLDEPSIGLHPRDTGQLIGVLHRLRDNGNTLLVVEHEESVIRTADHVVDMGPAQGERGGQVVFQGDLKSLLKNRESITAQYLNGTKSIPLPTKRREHSQRLTIRGATENNLKNMDVAIPLHSFVCVTGVSGSGKSTLVEEVLHKNLLKLKGKQTEEPGRCDSIVGHHQISDVVLVDQSPIGRTTRSNPVVYVGAFEFIRELFAATDEAQQHGIKPGDFSFNAGEGRCDHCGGNGFERVEMQFLSDVYLRCPDCNGKRFKPHMLQIRYRARSIADVLEMTVDDAGEFFADQPKIVTALQLLRDVGLGYLRLGQPVPTLSGGESQRLKIVGYLLEDGGSKAKQTGTNTLFLFDEPTTGLHFDDIRMLIAMFNRLVDQGHSVVVIEHNMDVVKCADWVIDLGPEAGENGGRLVAEGTTEQVAKKAESHTGLALRHKLNANVMVAQASRLRSVATTAASETLAPPANGNIRILGAREHNLKNLSVSIPRNKMVVITGISGSGKSTLAFDILFAEGQRRFLDSMSAYARQFVEQLSRPDVDHIEGIPPSAAIEQRVTRGGRKSTVATVTEAYHFIRLLFAKLGVQHCPDCGVAVEKQSESAIATRIARQARRGALTILAPVLRGRKGFGLEIAEWARKHGYQKLRVDGKVMATEGFKKLARYREHDIEIVMGESVGMKPSALAGRITDGLRIGKGQLVTTGSALKETIYSTERSCPTCVRAFEELDPKMFSFHSPRGWCPDCHGYGTQVTLPEDAEEEQKLEVIEEWNDEPCPVCHGARLNAQGLAVRLPSLRVGIADLCAASVAEGLELFRKLRFRGREAEIAKDIIPQIVERLHFMNKVGLGYLSLDRGAHTLSGGESQRIRLAAQLGSNLRGVLYVLDEPTIGLHARDNEMLLSTLETLKSRGNSLVVVEHDDMTMRRADHIIDLGPGAGVNGGRVVAAGSLAELQRHPESVTGQCLREPIKHPTRGSRRIIGPKQKWLTVTGARANNLQEVTARFPLGRFTCVTGVSGSGKSSLVRDVLLRVTQSALKNQRVSGDLCRGIKGADGLRAVYEVDQSPIGKTPRSTPATYTGIFDEIRRLYAMTPVARMRGYQASRFSFNSQGGGRCVTCEGQGRIKVVMNFLPDVYTPCETCRGARYNEETLDATFHDKSIVQVLAMSVDEAVVFFQSQPRIHRALELMQQTGLGYLTLGQTSPTLSGGEAQRLKLVTELAKSRGAEMMERGALYILEEPTIGLHIADIRKLVNVLHRLVDAGHAVVVIEHNLDLIAEADWIIDLGPEGGAEGGRVVVAGTPEVVACHKKSYTGKFLKEHLRR
ncbi:MAG: excinuclease ABC subunit A [Verrucomicrobiae bacterium]|nr:excinuclease ABC subunit A [Verrucomicrobiae bacterium]